MATSGGTQDWTAEAGVLGMERRLAVGLDLGQKHDYTAISVLERTRVVYNRRDPVTYDFLSATRSFVRHVERVPLGTTWATVVERVKSLVAELAAEPYTGAGRPVLVVDATGVGGPVVDMLKGARMACSIVPVTITEATG
jgi:hypothetical protein